jgi:hypothetical protein
VSVREVFWWGVLVGFIAAVLLGGLADRAVAQTSPEPVAFDARVVQLDAELGVFMASRGYGTPAAPVFVQTDSWFVEQFIHIPGVADGQVQVLAAASVEGTVLRPLVLGWINSPRRFGALVHVLAHEKAHRRQVTLPEVSRRWSALDFQIEEAASEAVARDITAAFLGARYPWVARYRSDSYEQGARMVRVCSARAHAGSWRHNRAVQWRKRFWKSTAPRRRALLTECGVRL